METVVTLATVPAVYAIIEWCKRLGATGKLLMALPPLAGVLIVLTEYLVGGPLDQVTAQGVYQAVAAGIILGLSASGIYDLRNPEPVEPELFEDENV